MDAIVLAGSNYKAKLTEDSSVDNDALLTIGNKAMVEYVVEAISKSPFIHKVVVVGPEDKLGPLFSNNPKVILAPGGATVIQGVLSGLQKLNREKHVLLASSDIPLLTTEAVDDFISECLKNPEVELFYSIVSKEVNDQKFPGVKRTYVKIKEGIFTGGNIMLIKPAIASQCAPKAEELVALRKSPLGLVRRIGLSSIFKYLLGILTIAEIEKRVSKLLGVKGKAVISNYPEIGVDVDKPSDLELVQQVMIKKKAN